MKLMTTLATAFLLSPLASFADGHQAELEAELLAFNDRFNAYAEAHDVDGIVSLYGEESLWIAPKTPPAPAPVLARQTFSFLVANEGSISHTVDHLTISDDGTQAVMIGDAIVLVEKAGLDFTGTYLFVLEKEGDTWEIVADMFNQHVEE
ncbi:nuclear transport factor 2 family protein [Lentibacter algarum]|uniref:YybH family protein n=1 Tax=Lentibacter algarum TaxID=576131 RepID=UPI001C07D546|nr:nuclear transport factor 2 family protein [Lentibacter algarum]MBU2981039.1 nuclear transport factor 2 family protein [Lentibacter algarum]